MTNQIGHLSAVQTELLKGLGIIAIVLHNFFHVLTPVIGENEFFYSTEAFNNFSSSIIERPIDGLRLIFSYFGHYGVHIFVFLSAYGLSRKYRHETPIFWKFMGARLSRIYPSFLLCVALFVTIKIARSTISGHAPDLAWESILWKLLLISNFVAEEAMMPSGPWWFIPFIIQLYIVYPLLLAGYRRYGQHFLLSISALSILSEWSLNPLLMIQGLNINHMVFGHLPVISLGIFMAHQNSFIIRFRYVALALAAFVAGNYSADLWLFSDLSFILLFLGMMVILLKSGYRYRPLVTILLFYGGISFELFMLNGFLRSPFVGFSESQDSWWADDIAGFAALGFSTGCAVVFRWFDRWLRTTSSRVFAT